MAEEYVIYNDSHTFSPRSVWKDEFASLMRTHQLNRLALGETEGFSVNSSGFAFLDNLTEIVQALYVQMNNPPILESIKFLRDLRRLELFLNDYAHFLDESWFEQVKELSFEFIPELSSLFLLRNLEIIEVFRYPHADIGPLKSMSRLRSLTLNSATKLNSLSSISSLTSLESLHIHHPKNLKSVQGVEKLKQLRFLSFDGSMPLNDFSFLQDLPLIETLTLLGKIQINSLESLLSAKNLSTVIIGEGANVVDGGIKFLSKLPNIRKVIFSDSPHYDVSFKDLHTILN